MKAIVSLCFNTDYNNIAKTTFQTFQGYAAKVNADFVVINQRIKNVCDGERGIWYEKYQIAELFDKYDRMLYLDADVLVNYTAPNIFEIVPEECFGAFDESRCDGNEVHFDIPKIKKLNGDINWDGVPYYNMGVMVVSKIHKNVFNLSHGRFSEGFAEQTQTNFNLQKLKLPVFNIPEDFNYHKCSNEKERALNRFNMFFIHYAGNSFNRFKLPRSEFISEELKKLKRGMVML